MIDIKTWPEAQTAERPKRLYLDASITPPERAQLAHKGWQPIDTRTMPNQSDAERAEAVKAFLEGVRVGSIEPDAKKLRFVELEAKLYLLNSRPPNDKREDTSVQTDDLNKLLDFNSNRAFRGTWQASKDKDDAFSMGPSAETGNESGPKKRKYVKRHERWNKPKVSDVRPEDAGENKN